MMGLMLRRRFRRLVGQNPAPDMPANDETDQNPEKSGAETGAETGAENWPDLVIIDGGAGQLTVARAVMTELGLSHIPLVAIAKGPDRNAGRERFFSARPGTV